MTTTFHHCDGAESRDLNWSLLGGGSPSNVSTNPASGSRAYSFASGDALAFPALTNGLFANNSVLPNDRFLVGMKFRFSDNSSLVDNILIAFIGPSSALIGTVSLINTGELRFKDTNGVLLDVSVSPVPVNSYFRLEIAIQTTATGTWEWWIDGVSEGSGTADFGTSRLEQINVFGPTNAAHQMDDLYVKSDDTIQPTPLENWEVFAFQAGSGATTTGSLDTGSVTDIDELPFSDVDEISLTTDNSEWSVETDAAGAGQAGPRLSGDIDGDPNIIMAVWHHRLKIAAGTDPTSLDQSFGNDTDTLQFVDRLADLTASYQDFLVGSDDKSTALPLSTEDFEYGIRKVGTGTKDILCSGIFVQLLHETGDVVSSSSSVSSSSVSSSSVSSSSSSQLSFIFDQRRTRFRPFTTL